MFVLGQCVYCDWMKNSVTHTAGDTANHGHFMPSYLIYMYLSKAEYVSQSKFACIQQANYAQLLES